MTFKYDKTGQHLRALVVKEGEQERMRAIQCLSRSYGTGSRAELASLLLATLGKTSTVDSIADQQDFLPAQTDALPIVKTSQVAQPLQPSANGPENSLADASAAN